MPALQSGDDVIIDSAAIIQYLADRHDKFTYHAGTIQRAQQDSFLHFANDEMDGPCWTAAKHIFAIPEKLRVPDVMPACKWDWDRAMKTLATRLGDNKFVMGDQFTVPDIVMGHVAGWAKLSGFEWPRGGVADYFNRVRSRPAFKTATRIRKES